MKVVYVEVKNKTLPEDENIEGWGVLLNGHLVATDSYKDSLTCGEIAESLAQALGASLEERTVEVSGRWDWIRDVIPKLGVRPERCTNGAVLPEKTAGILVRYTGISGEAEFSCATLIPYTGDVPAEEAVRDYFRDFFGEGTKQESDCVYFSPDGGRAAKINGWTVVPPEDFVVLKKYVR
jgi:hypothetical protein